jgi:putative hemolysin
MSAAPFLNAISTIARPIVSLLTVSSNIIVRLLGQRGAVQPDVTEEDIVYLTHEGIASGTVETGEEELIKRVFQFTDRPATLVMRPRSEMVAIETGTPLPEVIATFLDSGYSRLPIYQDTLDNIVGVLYAKDLLRAISVQDHFDYMQHVRHASFVLEHQHVDDLLTRFRREGTHIAIVLDEYSQVSGLITIEDILEELVGEIQDEYDTQEDYNIVQREDGSWLVDAMESYDRVRERVNLPTRPDKEQGDYHSLAGFIQAHLDRIPKEGDTVRFGDYMLEVVDMDGRRVDKVLIRKV